jgi:hypothetical protein
MARHHAQKPAEFFQPDLAPALVDVVHDILGKQRQHRLAVGCVEGLEIALDQRPGLLFAHGACRLRLQWVPPTCRAVALSRFLTARVPACG